MTEFKIGDHVRRTFADTLANTLVCGGEYEVASLTGTMITLVGHAGVYFPERFELVTSAMKTDEELANEYRELRKKITDLGKILRERGYEIRRKSDSFLLAPVTDLDVIIRKTINKEI